MKYVLILFLIGRSISQQEYDSLESCTFAREKMQALTRAIITMCVPK